CGCSGSSGLSSWFSSSSSAITFPFRWGRAASAMLAQSEHPVERNSRVVARAFIDRDAIDDIACSEIIERPEQVLRGDAEHRGAHANARVERNDFAIRHFFREPVHKVNFSAYGPLRTGRRCRDRVNDSFRRANLIGGLGYLEAAFRVRNHANAR